MEITNQSQQNWRQVKSFVKRGGRITAHQTQALQDLYPKFGLKLEDGIINFAQIFGRQTKVILEIGFGNGQNLIHMAQNQPNFDFIGVEVHLPGVGAVLAAIEHLNLSNVKIFIADAVEVLNNCIRDASLHQVCLFFPDPWPKKKHHKRRIVQPNFANLIAQKLQTNGYFYLATDWQNYAENMLQVLSNTPHLANCGQDFSERAKFRALTKFEQRGQQLGYKVWDLCFYKK